ncbi:MAG: deoxyribose-phosphate aldolase [Anaerofustis stercorihominis]|nr:deoxyribose-phosphate aldolase [Anaerofustis stercorihominis]
MKLTPKQTAKLIDHAILKPDATREDVKKGCLIAKEYDVMSVCVRGCDVAYAKELLQGTDVLVGTVIGFPHGSQSTQAKVAETVEAFKNGAVEVDVVMPIGMVKSGDYEYLRNELEELVEVVREHNGLIKVIFENCYLTAEEIARCTVVASETGVDFVKTSTGFGTSSAKIEDVQIMKGHVLGRVQVKASGGIRTYEDVLKMVEAGATRIGASATEAIVKGAIAAQGE